ncbi:hypothetical protein SLS59_000995 [Nothophoma quercina]|uniref:Uncharacterized protein n=1 Tax=Nothophoma quercina TaxID=749835 RepID=A0ABR3RYI1_9PLEO
MSTMCTTYEFNYLRCQREVKRDCKHADHFPCDTSMCKGNDHEHLVLVKEDKCPVHKMDDEKKAKERKMEEWPETNCKPM